MGSDLLPTRAVAQLLNCSPSTISRKVAAGELTPALKVDGLRGAMFFRRSDVEALLAEPAHG